MDLSNPKIMDNDIEFILETLNNVGIDIKNIKNYTDDDIKTFLL